MFVIRLSSDHASAVRQVSLIALIYFLGMIASLGILRVREKNLSRLQVSSVTTQGRITSIKTQKGRGGPVNTIHFEFTADGVAYTGKQLFQGASTFQENSQIRISYLPDKPSINAVNELVSKQLESIRKLNRLLLFLTPFPMILMIGVMIYVYSGGST